MEAEKTEKEIVEEIRSKISLFEKEMKRLLPALQMIQNDYKYIPPGAIEAVAEHFGVSPAEVHGVATFYNQFRFNPPGKHPIKVCLGTACHVRGGDIILENFERRLGIKEGETTEDRMFSIERVACVGCCALAPVGLVGDEIYGKMAPSKVEGLILNLTMDKK